jgi:tetratricopeptide (TPR) repeat protein
LYVLCSLGIIEEKRGSDKAEAIEEKVPFEEIMQSVLEDEHAFLAKVDEVYANLDVLGPSQLLEVDEFSKHESIMKNYYRLTKEFHPDRYLGAADPSLKDKLTAIFDALTRAYSEFKDKAETEKERETSATRSKSAAIFEKGVEAFKKGHFGEAVDLFRSSAEMEPSNARYWSYLSLCLCKMPRMMKEAEKALLNAVRLEPDNAEHHVNLGLIYLKQGIDKKARTQFEKALRLDSKNIRAKKGLEKTKG